MTELKERFAFDAVRFNDANWAVSEKRAGAFARELAQSGTEIFWNATIEVEAPVRSSAPAKPTGQAAPQTAANAAVTKKTAPAATAASPRSGGMFARNRQAARQPAAPDRTTNGGEE